MTALNPRGRNRAVISAHATRPALLPQLERVSTGNRQLDTWVEDVTHAIQIMNGSRTPHDRVVTHRELDAALNGRSPIGLASGQALPPTGGVPILGPNGSTTIIGWNEFAEKIRSSQLFADLTRRIDDPLRFQRMVPRVQEILLADLGTVTGQVNAAISRLDESIATQEQSFAVTSEQLKASVAESAAGVRRTAAASANRTRAVALDVTTVTATLGTLGGAGGSATVEEKMEAFADTYEGLGSQWTLKVQAGKAIAGIGAAATENTEGEAESAVIIMADRFAVISSSDIAGITDPLSPPTNRIPFGIDTVNDTIYINGQVRINTGGTRLEALGKRIVLTAPNNTFLVDRTGAATPTSIVITATRLEGLTGTTTWTVTSGSATLTSTSNTSATLTFANMSSDSATIQASVTMNSVTYTAQITLNKNYNGVRGAVHGIGTAFGLFLSGTSDTADPWPSGSTNEKRANRVVSNIMNAASLSTDLTSTSLNRIGDEVTLTNSGGTTAETRYWSGTEWVKYGVTINGNLLVNGTISASKLSVSTLSAITADLGTITAGTITGTTITGATVRTAASGARVELSGTTLKSTDGSSNYFEVNAAGKVSINGTQTVSARDVALAVNTSGNADVGVHAEVSGSGTSAFYGDADGSGSTAMEGSAVNGAIGVWGTAVNGGVGVKAEGALGGAFALETNGSIKVASAQFSTGTASAHVPLTNKPGSNVATANEWLEFYKGTTRGWVPWVPHA